MKCIIVGIKPQDYVRQSDGKPVKGFTVGMLANNADWYGKTWKDCYIDKDSPTYKKNATVFDDLDKLKGREVEAEWDVEQYGSKAVKRLITFDLLDDFYDIVKREAAPEPTPQKAAK